MLRNPLPAEHQCAGYSRAQVMPARRAVRPFRPRCFGSSITFRRSSSHSWVAEWPFTAATMTLIALPRKSRSLETTRSYLCD
jgi:hypothetical protein